MKTLVEFRSEVEEGKVLQFSGYPDEVILLCKLSNSRYACIAEHQGILKSGDGDSFTNFCRFIESEFIPGLDQKASWEVNTEELRKCSECSIPARDGEIEAGMCFDCLMQMRRATGSTYEDENLMLQFTTEPQEEPYQSIYNGGTWKPCLIIDGPDSGGYARNGRVVLDARMTQRLLSFLKLHESSIEVGLGSL